MNTFQDMSDKIMDKDQQDVTDGALTRKLLSVNKQMTIKLFYDSAVQRRTSLYLGDQQRS